MNRFQLPDEGPDNRFRYYGSGDLDVDANDLPEDAIPLTQRCETCVGMGYVIDKPKTNTKTCPVCSGTGRKQ